MITCESVLAQEAYDASKDWKAINAASNSAFDALQRKDYDTASTFIDEMLSLDPQNGEAYCFKAMCLISKADYDAALTALLKSKELGYKQPNLYLGLSIVYTKKDMPEQAGSSLLDLLSLNPNNAEALYGMAYLKYGSKKYTESLDYLDKAEAQGVSDDLGIRQKIRGAQESNIPSKGLWDNVPFQILVVIVIFGLIAVLIIVFVPETKKEEVPTSNIASPQSNDLPQTVYSSFIKAGPNKRVCTYLIDSLVIGLPNWGLGVLIGTTFGWILPGLYFLFKDAFNGQSVGKMVVGIQVVNEENRVAQPAEAITRNIPLTVAQVVGAMGQWFLLVAILVPIIEYFVMVNSKNGQRIGDKIAHTRVQDLKPQIHDNTFLFISIAIFIASVIFMNALKMMSGAK